MKDIMMQMYESFIQDPLLYQYIDKQSVKFYEYPNANTINRAVIVIDELYSPTPSAYGDDNVIAYDVSYQVDIFFKPNKNENGRLLSNKLIMHIQDILRENVQLYEISSSKPEYISDFSLYRQSKQFIGTQYKNEGDF